MISPTGKGIRQPDDFGYGHYGAHRGDKIHRGKDYACVPGQSIVMPFTGDIVRLSYPYKDDLRYCGVLLRHPYYEVYVWYIDPMRQLVGHRVGQGEKIGTAQDIAEKYNTDEKHMNPHVHLQIKSVDPDWFVIDV